MDRTLEVSMRAASKSTTAISFVKATLDQPRGHDGKAKKTANDKRRAAATTPPRAARATAEAKPCDATKLPTKE
jgi:hypothetical protein